MRGGTYNRKSVYRVLFLLVCITAAACSSTGSTRRGKEKAEGFFAGFMDQVTERECLTGRLTCPYGWGPANEPCDCTDPSGRVWAGRTIK